MSTTPQRFRAAFTLTELMVVIAVMSILAALGIPALSGLNSSGQFNRTILETAGLFEGARQYAVAQNTYVWVALSQDDTATGNGQLHAAVFASKDGTDPAPWSDYGSVSGSGSVISLVAPIGTFRDVKLADAGKFTKSDVASLPATPAVGSANSLADNTAAFSATLPATGAPVRFTRVVQFTPAGEARNGPGMIDVLELALQPQPTGSNTPNPANVAVLRINGLTGQTSVYRR